MERNDELEGWQWQQRGEVAAVVRETNPARLRSRGRTAGRVSVMKRDDGGAEEETAAHADGRTDGRRFFLL